MSRLFSEANTSRISNFLSFGLIFLVACIGGIVVALGEKSLFILLAGIIASILLMCIPASSVVEGMFVLIFLVVGQLIYFARIDQAYWLPYVISGALMLRLPMESTGRRNKNHSGWNFPAALWVFISILILSSILNKTGLLQIFVGLKNYILPWFFAFFVAMTINGGIPLLRTWKSFLLVVMLQVPFVVYQHFYVMRARAGGALWDSVVGSFGGNPDGGGASGTMAIFVVFGMACAFVLKRSNVISAKWFWYTLLAGLITIFMAEIKVVFVLIPFAAALIFRKEIIKKPIKTLFSIIPMGLALFILLFAYRNMYMQDVSSHRDSFESVIEKMTHTEAEGAQFFNRRTGELTRTGAIIVWWDKNFGYSPTQFVFGYGPAASRVSATVGYGDAAKKYPFSLTTSSLSVLLWDTGILGASFFITIIISGMFKAYKLSSDPALDVTTRAIFESIFVGLAIVLVTLPYNRDAVDSPMLQFLVAYLFGVIGSASLFKNSDIGKQQFKSPLKMNYISS